MRAQLRIDFQGRGKVETFPRACIQAMRDDVQLTLRVPRQVRALGQVLAQQAIRILVGAALPGAVRIGKEDLDRKPLGQLLVLGHLFPSIVRQGFPQQGGHMPEFLGKALAGTRGIRPVHSGQDDQAGGPLHQGPDGRPIAGTLDEIAFPVARHRAGHHLGGTRGNRRHIGDLAPPIRAPRSRATRLVRLTQSRQQFGPQCASRQHVQTGIDGFSRQVFTHVVRIRVSETSSNLLGRAALGQMRPHILPQPGIQEFPRSSRLTSSDGRLGVSGAGPIGSAARGVARRLAAHGAGGSPQHPGHRSQRMAVGQSQTQGFTFFGRHVSIGSG